MAPLDGSVPTPYLIYKYIYTPSIKLANSNFISKKKMWFILSVGVRVRNNMLGHGPVQGQ